MNEYCESIPVIESRRLRKGPRVVTGVLDAGILIERHVVPRRDTRTKSGYQRDLSKARVNRLQNDLRRESVDLPTAILLSMRNGSSALNEAGDGRLYLDLDGRDLNVVDGQHRVAALRGLVEENPSEWAGFKIPFVCVIGADEHQEMEQFYVVNSTAKSVRTDLAYDLLKQQAENDPTIFEVLEERGERWKVTGQTLVERLAEDSVLWRHQIRFPGEPMANTTINNSGMANSLKKLLSSAFFANLTTDNQVKILDAFWHGLQIVLPDCFEHPIDYALQKSTGVMAMHLLLLTVIEHVRSKGDSVIEPDSFAEVLSSPLTKLEGENRDGETVRGVDFWRVGSDGAAGMYSSNAGRRVLLAKIHNRLPKIDIE